MYIPRQAWGSNVHKKTASVITIIGAFVRLHIHPPPQYVDLRYAA
jgi:hypothetical protein